MAILTIKGVEHEAKFNFLFSKKADEKYSEKDEKGKNAGGFHSVYTGLLQSSNDSLVAFWDCGLAHLKGSDKPSVEDIQNALVERIEADEDTLPLFREAYQAIDASGFFKQQCRKLWKNIETLKNSGATDEKKAENLKMYEAMDGYRKELTD